LKPFDKKIGIVGGGQLGKMLIESSRKWNVKYNILDAANAPSGHLVSEHIVGSLNDGIKINELGNISDVLTYEIEHINVDALQKLEDKGMEVIPSSSSLRTIKDKGLQKQFYSDNGISTAPFVMLNSSDDWKHALETLKSDKLVIKTRTDGYDGKGVRVVTRAEAESAEIQNEYSENCLVEECIDFEKELAIIVAVDTLGNTECYPIVEMEFHPTANLVEYLLAPAQLSKSVEESAIALSAKVAESLNSPGLFAVELFLDSEDRVYVNETAPRPHNSGHHTIEACYTSQYEQLNRILLGLPLGSCELMKPAVMINIVGPEGVSGYYQLDNLSELMCIPGCYVHLYNKEETRPFRKLGHITVVDETVEEVVAKAKEVKNLLKLIPAGSNHESR
jgi:5-(carboxyamino)imidazole ribonucleotide synthase